MSILLFNFVLFKLFLFNLNQSAGISFHIVTEEGVL